MELLARYRDELAGGPKARFKGVGRQQQYWNYLNNLLECLVH